MFSAFYEYVDKTQRADFYCYGNCDGRFVKATLRYVKSFRAQCALSLIYAGLTDISPEISVMFKTNQTVSLYKLADYYGAVDERNHHALNDAKLLKHVYEYSRGEELDECPFPEYVQVHKNDRIAVSPPEEVKNPRVTAVHGDETRSFASYGKAADWIITELLPKNAFVTADTKSNISNRIVQAAANGGTYHGYVWSDPHKAGGAGE